MCAAECMRGQECVLAHVCNMKKNCASVNVCVRVKFPGRKRQRRGVVCVCTLVCVFICACASALVFVVVLGCVCDVLLCELCVVYERVLIACIL
jgi:hypothetical protein